MMKRKLGGPRLQAWAPQMTHHSGKSDYTLEDEEGTHRLVYIAYRKWLWIRPDGSIITLWECVGHIAGQQHCPCLGCQGNEDISPPPTERVNDYALEDQDGEHFFTSLELQKWMWERPDGSLVLLWECVARLVGHSRCDCTDCRGRFK